MTSTPSPDPRPIFSLLVKPAGADCNLDCKYCFYRDKGQLYPGSHLRMSTEVLETYIQQFLACQEAIEACIAWQGGEPTLMGLDFFRHAVELVEKHKRACQRVTYSLQTNGILLDRTWCAFFKEHDFLIGLSLDGPQEMHDAFRLDMGGQGTYQQVKRSWDLLQESEVDTNILCALHAANAGHPLEVYRFFRDELQAKYIQFIPIVEKLLPEIDFAALSSSRTLHEKKQLFIQEANLVSPRSIEPEQYGHFLMKVFDEWVQRDVGKVFVQIFDSALAAWCHMPANVCTFQETCGQSLVLEHNGDLYSCDHFVEPAYRLGNILETTLRDLVASQRQSQFGLDKRNKLPVYCQTCEVEFACRGGCPRNRFIETPRGKIGLNYLCVGYRLFFQHVDRPMRIMAILLHQGRAPAEIMGRKEISKR
jgi:uncharacterized protein